MAVAAVIFEWGGTLTPWHTIDHEALWREVCAPHFPAGEAEVVAAALCAAEREKWVAADAKYTSGTLEQIMAQAGVEPTKALLASYFELWDPHTLTDPEAAPLLRELRRRGIRVGVLSNTMWPRSAHERVFIRDEVLELIDAAVYTSEIAWSKRHPEAFRAIMAALGVDAPQNCVFVGDRPYDDIHGAKGAGMRAVLIPHSEVPPTRTRPGRGDQPPVGASGAARYVVTRVRAGGGRWRPWGRAGDAWSGRSRGGGAAPRRRSRSGWPRRRAGRGQRKTPR